MPPFIGADWGKQKKNVSFHPKEEKHIFFDRVTPGRCVKCDVLHTESVETALFFPVPLVELSRFFGDKFTIGWGTLGGGWLTSHKEIEIPLFF